MKARWWKTAAAAAGLAALMAAPVGCDDGDASPADGGADGMGGVMADSGGEGGTGGAEDMGGAGGEGGQGGMPDTGPEVDAGPDMDPVADLGPEADAAAPDMAPFDSPIDCPAICTGLQTECPEAFAIHGDCDDCEALSGAFAGGLTPPLQNAADVCITAAEDQDCRGLYTCLVDPDGLLAVGTGASLTIVGNVGGVDYDLQVDDAWAAVGVKNDGRPSDLELSFVTDDGRFLVVKFDDLAADIGELGFGLLDAGNNEVQVKIPGERVDLDTGLVEVVRFVLPGGEGEPGFQINAEVRENREATPVTVTARGTFR